MKNSNLRLLRPFHYILLAVVAVSVFSVVYYNTVHAAMSCPPGLRVLGRACWRGYFSNTLDAEGTNVLPAIDVGQALPRTGSQSINSADELVDRLQIDYRGGAQQRTGAAFIYNTMMAVSGNRASRTVTNAQWNELRARLRGLDAAGQIVWNRNVDTSKQSYLNSYWQGTGGGSNPNDDAYFQEDKNEPGITIKDYSGREIYWILRRCANPVGRPTALPPEQRATLTPSVTSVTPTSVAVGGQVSVGAQVAKDRASPIMPDVKWQITAITVRPGASLPTGGVSDEGPCGGPPGPAGFGGTYFKTGGVSCEVAESATFTYGRAGLHGRGLSSPYKVPDVPAGTKICFALSVHPYSTIDSKWRHSNPTLRCVTVSKSPKVQIWGGDLWTSDEVRTSSSVSNDKLFGSWAEYGVLVQSGASQGIASGAAFSGGLAAPGGTPPSLDVWNKLTFANVDDSGSMRHGNYGALSGIASVAGQFSSLTPSGSLTGTTDLNAVASGVYSAGNLTISASTIGQQGPSGKRIIIVSTGVVTIDGDITYKGPGGGDTFTTGKQIPQLVIVAPTINIANSTGHVDAWLLATGPSGTINTCSDVAPTAPLTINMCSRQLTVNGVIETTHLYLRRTGGSGTGAAAGDPAEILNNRADASIWSSNYAATDGKVETVYTTELPPRF